ncbi:replication initiation protein RepC [Paracoccus seriniphilus]|uniref:Replication initiation protein RepC n=2 Tax=Paracoccus seriniphilus TaxID=184748 RepID=A0A239Q2R3_9RHOB|nr:replication initiation protein [Paracoccus seriniphilus]SNT76730.1 replication initiation protein RepC [Paracoccus seriniphilus]
MADPAQVQESRAEFHVPMPRGVDKWQLLRELSVARKEFGLSDRDLTVLQALISFYPGTCLDSPERMVIHASNATICERLHGMPCSTMRRHLARLIDSGLLMRRDSPNGKRYVRRGASGTRAFGIDLTPLPYLFERITQTADRVRAEAAELAMQRETVSLMRRDLLNALHSEPDLPSKLTRRLWDIAEMSGKLLRRKLNLEQINELKDLLTQSLDMLGLSENPLETVKLSSSDSQNEQHIQNTKKDYSESEKTVAADSPPAPTPALDTVLSACHEVQAMSADEIRNWNDLHQATEQLYPMMGIGSQVWHEAKQRMGATVASITLAAILQRFTSIRSPGAYLRSLTAKAANGRFSVTPMIQALAKTAHKPSSQL